MQAPYHDSGDGYGGPGQVRLAMPSLGGMVKKLMIANGVVYALSFVLFLLPGSVLQSANEWLGMTSELWSRMFPLVPLWQVGTYGFLHSIDPLHILWNLLLLYFFGTMLEGIIGSRRFLVVYMSAMIAGALLHLAGTLAFGDSPPAIGASGAVLGVLVATATLYPNRQVLMLFIPVRLGHLAIVIVLLDFIRLAIGVRLGAGDGVAHFVHLGGAAYGFLAARRGWIWWDPMQKLAARRAVAQESALRDEEHTMDQLLDKIHREGLGALTAKEKRFLQKASERRGR